MTDPAAPTEVSTGAAVACTAQDPTVKEVAVEGVNDSAPAASKGKGKAVEQTPDEDEEDDDDDEDDEDDDDSDDDDDIEPGEVDPTNISSYGVGQRPTRNRKPIDYSSEEALQKAGLASGQAGDEEDEDRDFKGDVSMDG